ncbi:MAG: hypothetical protein JXJ04_18320 [Spirochaetales bacterium]|nr:hypothetical protein [Spirochaetales bacterium]
MTEQESVTLIEKFLEDRNYLSAYLGLKESSLSRERELEFTGKITQHIITELGYSSGRKDKEKVYFYRSLLLMIFQDIPGLARIYKRQLQSSRELDSPMDFLKHIKNFNNLATDNSDLKETINDTIEDISEKIEDAKDDMEENRLDESVKDLFSIAEESIKEGVKGFNDFLKKITTPPPPPKPPKEKKEPPLKQAEPIVDEESPETDEKQPGNSGEEK